MAQQTIGIGGAVNDGTGDQLRTAFTKTNANFTELYASVATKQTTDADLTAIAALTGTSGFLKKTAANTWALDTSTYITGITSNLVTTALGFTPYNGTTNPNGYLTAASSLIDGNTVSSVDADIVVNAATTPMFSYIQSASTTARTINISNLIPGRKVMLYLRNTNAGTKVINIAAGASTSYTAVNMSKGDSGGTSVTSVTLAATSGTATIILFNAGGTIGGSIG